MSQSNGWLKGGVLGVMGLAIGALVSAGVYKSKIDDLILFKHAIEADVEQWRTQEAGQEFTLKSLQIESVLARTERAELFKRLGRLEAHAGVNGGGQP